MGPLVILSIVLMQGATIVNAYSLTWWTENAFNKDKGFYLGIYAGLGVSVALFTFMMVSWSTALILLTTHLLTLLHRVSLPPLWASMYLSNYTAMLSPAFYMHQ